MSDGGQTDHTTQEHNSSEDEDAGRRDVDKERRYSLEMESSDSYREKTSSSSIRTDGQVAVKNEERRKNEKSRKKK